MDTRYSDIYAHDYYIAGDEIDEMRVTQLQRDGETNIPILDDRFRAEPFGDAVARTIMYALSLAYMIACNVTTEVRGNYLYVQAK